MSNPRVFISYSHDSPEQSGRVLKFAWALRGHGIDVELDQFHNEEIVDWPRWCRRQIKREQSDFIVCICTAEYQRRIDSGVPPEKGKGVYWEGALIDDEIYDAKGNRRIVPVLFTGEPDTSVLDFLRGWTFCRIDQFALIDPGYEHLIRILTGQVRVEKNALGAIPVLTVQKAPSDPPDLSGTRGQATAPEVKLTRSSPFDEPPQSHGQDSQKAPRLRWFIAALLVPCVLGYPAWLFWTKTNSYQVSAMIRQASDVVMGLGDDGIADWADSLAFAGRQDDALAFARRLRKADEQTAALAAIAVRVVQRGDPDQGYSILSQALAEARQIPENRRMDFYARSLKTARALTLKGRGDLTVRLLDTLKTSYLPTVPSGNNRSYVARLVAEEYIAAGRLDSAKEILLSALPEASKDRHNWSQVSLATSLGRVGEKEKAIEVLKNAERETKRKKSEPEWDVNVAEEFMSLANAYRTLKVGEGQSAMVTAAIDAAKEMKSADTLHSGYNIKAIGYFGFSHEAAAFVRDLVRNGMASSVEEFINREGYPNTRVEMRVAVAGALEKIDAAAAGRYIADAEKEAGLIEDNELRAEAFCALAQSSAQNSKADDAFRFLDGALAAARGMREEYDSVNRRDCSAGKAQTLAEIALRLADVGRTSDSVVVAHEAEKASKLIAGDPSYYLPRISQALANSGEISLAHATADRAINGSDRLSAYAAVLRGLATKNEGATVRVMKEAEKREARDDES